MTTPLTGTSRSKFTDHQGVTYFESDATRFARADEVLSASKTDDVCACDTMQFCLLSSIGTLSQMDAIPLLPLTTMDGGPEKDVSGLELAGFKRAAFSEEKIKQKNKTIVYNARRVDRPRE